jgi:hypothetical protein
MGRGGDGRTTKKTTVAIDSVEKTYKLADLSTEQLKEWCEQYGIKSCNGDRVLMLKELVRLSSLDEIVTYISLASSRTLLLMASWTLSDQPRICHSSHQSSL